VTNEFALECPAGGETVRVSGRIYQPVGDPAAWLILAHGAGAGHDSAFMVSYGHALAARGLAAVTFNFPYTERGRRVPDPPRTLESCWRVVIDAVRERAGHGARLVAGGKSMGGRIASQVAAEPGVAARISGLVFLGYPLHPPDRPQQRRTAHWPQIHVPALFVQGSRDSFASPTELRDELSGFSGPTTLLIVDGGDHSFKVTRAAGRAQESVHAEIHEAVADWISRLPPG
jgi:uncharacterized protein